MLTKILSIYSTSAFALKIEDYKQLVKFRLNLFVVFSAVSAFIIVSGGAFAIEQVLLLALGGFLITGSANALNEVLEKDYDKLMRRTSNRPLPSGRMTISEAVLSAGFMFVIGLFILAVFNPLAAVIGSFAVISYAFIYTPLKRFSTLAVTVGAVPGALPVLIGAVAFDGYISGLALLLFGIQFLWQFPHFWAIGWLGFEDYKKAGYKLVPVKDGQPDNAIGMQSAIYTVFIVPLTVLAFNLGHISLIPCVLIVLASVLYSVMGYKLYKNSDSKSARQLMFSSFMYLPFVLFVLLFFNA